MYEICTHCTAPRPSAYHDSYLHVATFLSLFLLFSFPFSLFFLSFPFLLSVSGLQGGGKALSAPDPCTGCWRDNRNCSPPLFTLFFSFPHFWGAGARASPPPPPTELQLVGGKLLTDIPLFFSSLLPLFSFFLSLSFDPSLLFFDVGGGGGAGVVTTGRQGPSPPPPISFFFPFYFLFFHFPFSPLSLLFVLSLSLFSVFPFFRGGGGGLDLRL